MWDGLDPVGAVDAQRRRRDDDPTDLVVLDPLEHAPLVHVPVLHDLIDVAHWRQRDTVPFGDRERVHLAERARPRRDHRVGRLAIGDARRVIGEARVIAQILPPHRFQQIVPVLFDGDVRRNVAVIGRVDVQRHAAVAGVAGPRRRLAGSRNRRCEVRVA